MELTDINGEVDRVLAAIRPNRYEAGDRGWRAPAYAVVAESIDPAEAVAAVARQIVDRREQIATRSANELLRRIGRSSQWPLDWLDAEHQPISIGGARIRLDAANPDDLRRWAASERAVAAADFSARNDACVGAEWLADHLTVGGWSTLGEAIYGQLGGVA